MTKHFYVFGQAVEVVVTSAQSGGAFAIGRQTCPPGAGTPPHVHRNEDEAFSVVSGRFELFDGTAWNEIPVGSVVFAPRGQVHCFRNCGETDGVIQFVAGGEQFDRFLEGLSSYSLPEDVQAIVDYSAEYGIFYPTLPPPTVKAAQPEDVAVSGAEGAVVANEASLLHA